MPDAAAPRSDPQACAGGDAEVVLPVLGVLMLQTRFPRLPRDIGHPDSLPGRVLRRVVPGATPARVVRSGAAGCGSGEDDEALLAPSVAAGLQLVAGGAQALTTSCGFLARWQRPLQARLPVPLWSSALLTLAEMPGTRFGVVTAEAASLTARHLIAVGADPATPVEGIEPGSPLHRTLLQDLPALDAADARAQVVAAGRRLLARHPGIEAFVLECTDLPPYAPALHAACGRPVHDVITLVTRRRAALRRVYGTNRETSR